MYCNKCGKENNNTNKFCIGCGEKLENNIIDEKKEKKGYSNLSIVSLIFCILQFVLTFISSKIEFLSFLSNIPWILISLVLAIISRCIHKDTMSLIMIIIDAILIVLLIILLIALMMFFAALFETLLTGCSQLS